MQDYAHAVRIQAGRSPRFGNDAGTVVKRLAETRIGRHAHRRHEVDEHVLDDLARQITRNEDDAGAPIAGRPRRQQHRRMEYMLHAVYDGRRVVALEIQDALDTQQLLSFQTHQHGKPLNRLPFPTLSRPVHSWLPLTHPQR